MARRAFGVGSLFFAVAWGLAGCPATQSESDLVADDPGTGGRAAPQVVNATSSPGIDDSQSAATDADLPGCTTPVDEARLADEVIDLVNVERMRVGVKPVTRSEVLESQAASYACELIQYDYFAHVNPVTSSTLRDRAAAAGYDYRVIGENLAAGQTSAQRAMADWMDSPSHRENILDPRFTELGVGVRIGGDYGVYWVQEFGLPGGTTP